MGRRPWVRYFRRGVLFRRGCWFFYPWFMHFRSFRLGWAILFMIPSFALLSFFVLLSSATFVSFIFSLFLSIFLVYTVLALLSRMDDAGSSSPSINKNTIDKNTVRYQGLEGEKLEGEKFKYERSYEEVYPRKEISYCPYCGAKIEDDYVYCPKCGRKLV
ncbi:MAG: zinc-ribbon domain-containing protein [Candidatus Odinarchaeota archaeon]|nr:zinc-ribbon domain-containing protein [Candidatus Odinarchaeota archaeon]